MAKILVIEDIDILREEIAEWLMLEGYNTFDARDGVDGVAAALRHQPDLIICDVMMPRLDGYGVLSQIRANEATMAIPFIFMTAKAAQEDIQKGVEEGADEYITKPFSRVDLLGAIERRLANKAAL